MIGGDFGVAVQLVDDTYSNHNPFHIEDYLLLKFKLLTESREIEDEMNVIPMNSVS